LQGYRLSSTCGSTRHDRFLEGIAYPSNDLENADF
jgi:hypothetical protein